MGTRPENRMYSTKFFCRWCVVFNDVRPLQLKEVQKLQGPTSELMEVERFFLLFRDFPHCADYQVSLVVS